MMLSMGFKQVEGISRVVIDVFRESARSRGSSRGDAEGSSDVEVGYGSHTADGSLKMTVFSFGEWSTTSARSGTMVGSIRSITRYSSWRTSGMSMTRISLGWFSIGTDRITPMPMAEAVTPPKLSDPLIVNFFNPLEPLRSGPKHSQVAISTSISIKAGIDISSIIFEMILRGLVGTNSPVGYIILKCFRPPLMSLRSTARLGDGVDCGSTIKERIRVDRQGCR